MFKYFENKEINYIQWDDCVNHSDNGMIYALSWYLDITTPGWDGIVWLEGEKYTGVMPIPVFRKFGIKYIKQPLFTQQLGIFFRDENSNKFKMSEIEDILQRKFSYIQKYNFNYCNRFHCSEPKTQIEINKKFTLHLNLNLPYGEILKGYKSDRKWRINKAKRSDLKIVESENIEALISIFHENVAYKIYGIKGNKYDYRILKELYNATKERNLSILYAVKNDHEEILAMGLFFNYQRHIIYIFNASTAKGKKLNAISLLIDHVIRKNAKQDLHFDFEAPDNQKVTEFYRRFGGSPIPFASISLNNLPSYIQLLKDIRFKLYRRFIKAPNENQQ